MCDISWNSTTRRGPHVDSSRVRTATHHDHTLARANTHTKEKKSRRRRSEEEEDEPPRFAAARRTEQQQRVARARLETRACESRRVEDESKSRRVETSRDETSRDESRRVETSRDESRRVEASQDESRRVETTTTLRTPLVRTNGIVSMRPIPLPSRLPGRPFTTTRNRQPCKRERGRGRGPRQSARNAKCQMSNVK